MARIDSLLSDFHSGHRQRSDSGSSRESSPKRPIQQPIRSFSPTSDDGNLVVHVPDDDTPPPEDRPIIRQSLGAFGSSSTASTFSASLASSSTSVETYAPNTTTAADPKSARPQFLPGQRVDLPSPPPVPEKKKKPRSRKPKEDVSNQTKRFRLPGYNFEASTPSRPPNPSETPGPYSAQFRTTDYNHTPHQPPPNPYSGPSASPASVHPVSNGAHASATVARFSVGDLQKKSHSGKSAGPSDIVPTSVQLPHATPYPTHGQAPPQTVTPASYMRNTEYPHSYTNHGKDQAPQDASDDSHLRMVTVLIRDQRAGQDDSQLVEIKIPIKPAVNSEDGFWADAKVISNKLQQSPGRIDGPAKVYCMRGTYRQIFLRVTADNKDICDTANIIISRERTLEITVDDVGPPRPKASSSPARKHSSRRRSYSPDSDYSDYHRRDRYPSRSHRRKRRHSPRSSESDQYDRYDSHTSYRRRGSSSTMVSPRYESAEKSYSVRSWETRPQNKRSRRESHSPDESTLDSASVTTRVFHVLQDRGVRGHDSPNESDDDLDIEEKMVHAADTVLQREPDYANFFKARARKGRAQDVLLQYELVHKWFAKYSGSTPFRSTDHTITEVHLCKALHIEEPDQWALECRETMELLALYGPQGTRLQDPRVQNELAVTDFPTSHEKPMKRLRKLLREINVNWRREYDPNFQQA